MAKLYLQLLLIKLFLVLLINSSYPIAIFIGLSDDCTSTNFIIYNLELDLNIKVKCFDLHNGDRSWMMSMEDQAETACEKINNHPLFSGNFSIIGISQGGLIARSIIQKCELKGKVIRFLSFSTPHMGISSLSQFKCGFDCSLSGKMRDNMNYDDILPYDVGPAGYFKN